MYCLIVTTKHGKERLTKGTSQVQSPSPKYESVQENSIDELSAWLSEINLANLDPILRKIGATDLGLLKELQEEDLADKITPFQKRVLFKNIKEKLK